MRTILFSERFAPLVAAGLKTTTIRRIRGDREWQVGESASLRAWTGLPYRSKQRTLRKVTICSVTRVELFIPTFEVNRWGARLNLNWRSKQCSAEEFDRMAQADGFGSRWDLLEWFANTHGPGMFIGSLIRWSPTALIHAPPPWAVGMEVRLVRDIIDPANEDHPTLRPGQRGEKVIIRSIGSGIYPLNVSHEDRTDGATFSVAANEIEPWPVHIQPNAPSSATPGGGR